MVIATGARYRRLGQLENFERFEGGNGIHYAATAIEAGLCEREEVAVVGGGNSAGQAAVYLSRFASHVHMLVRGEGLAASMSDYLVGRIEASDRITLHTQTEVVALAGERHLERVTWRNRRTGEEETLPRRQPVPDARRGAEHRVAATAAASLLDDKGFVRVGGAGEDGHPRWEGRAPHMLETSRPGIFAVGDVRAGSVKRVASSVGEGSVVVSSVHQVLAGS